MTEGRSECVYYDQDGRNYSLFQKITRYSTAPTVTKMASKAALFRDTRPEQIKSTI